MTTRCSLSASMLFGFALGFAACGGGSSDEASCPAGTYFCPCLGGACLAGLECINNFCIGDDPGTSGNPGDGDPGDGDPGDGDPGDGDPGDGDPGDGDGDPGDGDGESGDGDGDLCGFPLQYTPPNVMFVLDASNAMATTMLDHDQNPNTPQVSRWNLVISGLQAVLPSYQALMRAGVKRFPSSNATTQYNWTSCTTSANVEAAVAINNAATIFNALPGANADNSQIKGASPARLGYEAAVTQLIAQVQPIPRAIVLIVDSIGACVEGDPFPNYLEDADTELASFVADSLQLDNITTHAFGIQLVNQVIGAGNEGSPEGNPHVWLNEIATAGGAPLAGSAKYRNASNLSSLQAGLEEVLDSLVCSMDLGSQPDGAPTLAELPKVFFELDGAPIPKIASCAAGDGWAWVDEGQLVVFCGSYCQSFKSDINGFVGGYCGG